MVTECIHRKNLGGDFGSWKTALKNEKNVSLYQKLFKAVVGVSLEFDFVNISPISTNDGKFIWEIRRDKGLDYDEKDERQNKMVYDGSIID